MTWVLADSQTTPTWVALLGSLGASVVVALATVLAVWLTARANAKTQRDTEVMTEKREREARSQDRRVETYTDALTQMLRFRWYANDQHKLFTVAGEKPVEAPVLIDEALATMTIRIRVFGTPEMRLLWDEHESAWRSFWLHVETYEDLKRQLGSQNPQTTAEHLAIQTAKDRLNAAGDAMEARAALELGQHSSIDGT